MEDHDLVNTVNELGSEQTLQTFHRLRTHCLVLLIALILAFPCRETNAHSTLEISTAGITGHNHHRILKVHGATLTIGQTTIIHDLQQSIEDLWMCFLNLVQQDDAIRSSAHLFGQLATLVIADITRRATEQTRYSVRLHILRHIEADQVSLTTEEFCRQGPRQFRLTHTRRA